MVIGHQFVYVVALSVSFELGHLEAWLINIYKMAFI
jgi:hypothetical protein